ncbi:hypothetical protein A2U01_0088630 [Trifolium medium]|uniref:Uncharacterized protein n=1 Tax=Trifolium medium TaxID=97028 RepID=A0A392U1R9_9FABA|nr:hypothetical protein [Trifolium medium]
MQESMYNMQLNQQVMSPADFQAHLAWPGDKSHFSEGADGDGADDGANDDDAVDDAAADAFEDDDEMQDD